ncbi:MAG: hypothetical protein ABIG95_03860 [Candidatus Woesearchaeota archaeon]
MAEDSEHTLDTLTEPELSPKPTSSLGARLQLASGILRLSYFAISLLFSGRIGTSQAYALVSGIYDAGFGFVRVQGAVDDEYLLPANRFQIAETMFLRAGYTGLQILASKLSDIYPHSSHEE